MKSNYLLLLFSVSLVLNACNFEEKSQALSKERIAEQMRSTISDESEETTISKSKATLEMTIDGQNYNAQCNDHYLNIAKERSEDTYSYSLRINMDKNEYPLNAFQLTFQEKGKLEFPYEVELDFKKSATDRKLRTSLSVFYVDGNDKVIQTSNDVGKILITEMTEDKVTLEVDTKLLLLKTVNMKGEGETVHLKGKIHSIHPVVTMMGGATKEDVF